MCGGWRRTTRCSTNLVRWVLSGTVMGGWGWFCRRDQNNHPPAHRPPCAVARGVWQGAQQLSEVSVVRDSPGVGGDGWVGVIPSSPSPTCGGSRAYDKVLNQLSEVSIVRDSPGWGWVGVCDPLLSVPHVRWLEAYDKVLNQLSEVSIAWDSLGWGCVCDPLLTVPHVRWLEAYDKVLNQLSEVSIVRDSRGGYFVRETQNTNTHAHSFPYMIWSL